MHRPSARSAERGKRVERRITPTFERPWCALLLGIVVGVIAADEDDKLGSVGILETRTEVASGVVDDGEVLCDETPVDVVERAVEVTEVVLVVDPAVDTTVVLELDAASLVLLSPPYVHPSPSGIDGP